VPELPPKKDVALVLLQRSSVFIHLDPRAANVIVPGGFKKEPRLVLQIGRNMAVPIPDLAIDDDGWSGTLSFQRVPFRCVIPWSSVFAMVGDDGRWIIWPEDVPPELEQRQSQPGTATPKVALAPKAAQSAPAVAPAPAADSPPPEEKKPKAKTKRAKRKGDGTSPASSERGQNQDVAAGPEASAEASTALTSASAEDAAVPTPAPAARPTPVDDAIASEPAGPPPGKTGKPKRELPPYLRVIK